MHRTAYRCRTTKPAMRHLSIASGEQRNSADQNSCLHREQTALQHGNCSHNLQSYNQGNRFFNQVIAIAENGEKGDMHSLCEGIKEVGPGVDVMCDLSIPCLALSSETVKAAPMSGHAK